MEALSPRSVNIQSKEKMKSKETSEDEAKRAEAARKAQKEKEYAPPPPEWVIQPPITAGSLAEKFKTGRLLGKGGFAVCYEGELRSKKIGVAKKNLFALKIVRSKMSQKKMEEKFRTELQIHAKMRHPNIVEFYRAFTYKECTYVVLELCSNGSVMDMVKKRKCLTLPEVRRLTIQLCGAIKYMHARNVIHRDLKMGNLFLDHEMNLKIGDFGLAAVLVSKDEVQGLIESAKQRRTTLCGTPNYIAPEILEKGKGGHDHKVDIWAIGVIVFAMLAGQPPFQSSSQSEIYRRAKSVEYAWPEENKHSNDIPPEARSLVASLLKVDAAERPGPDEVISHPFFSMHGGTNIPAVMEPSQRYETPSFIDSKAIPRGDVMWADARRVSLKNIAKHCGVGLMPGEVEPYASVGADTSLSLYMECVVEEQSGASPMVPLPHDFVYASKFSSTVWPSLQESVSEEPVPPSDDVVMLDIAQNQPPIQGSYQNKAVTRPRRAPIQSHAATLRAAHAGKQLEAPKSLTRDHLSEQDATRRGVAFAPSEQRRRGLMTDLPLRPSVSAAPNTTSQPANTDQRRRAVRTKKVITLEDGPDPIPTGTGKATSMPPRDLAEKTGRHGDVAAEDRARIASNVRNELSRPVHKERKASQLSVGDRPRLASNPTGHTLIGPNEVCESLPHSRPEMVLQRLQELHQRLDACLHSDIKVKRTTKEAREVEAKAMCFKSRPVVIKWVDYTNKFGIGYILANGSVGCVFKGDDASSPTCVVVPEAESHFKKRKSSSYTDKHQIVPRAGPPIEFVENCGVVGFKRVLVQPSQYQVRISSTGVPERLGPGFDVYDFEKRKKLCLWDKFGKYMTQSLGKEDDNEEAYGETSNGRPTRPRRTVSASSNAAAAGASFVKFYQRLGNVGIWGFVDGCFQFNFPDHTKLVVSADGSWLDFYHLPPSAAQFLKHGRVLSPTSLADRGVLCYPTDVLLAGQYGAYEFSDIVNENELRAKVEFVRDVVATWVKEGGLGCMGSNQGWKWMGVAEKGGKLVWVSVGAHGGDGRYEMPPPASTS